MLLTEPIFPRKCQLLLATFLSIHQSFYFEIIFCERAQLALLFSLHSIWKCIAHPMQLFSIHFLTAINELYSTEMPLIGPRKQWEFSSG